MFLKEPHIQNLKLKIRTLWAHFSLTSPHKNPGCVNFSTKLQHNFCHKKTSTLKNLQLTAIATTMVTLNDLKQAINNSEWDRVSQIIKTDSSLVKKHYLLPTFLGGFKEVSDVLPLHHVCSRDDAPLQLIQRLVLMYPKSIDKKESSLRRTCLHIALLKCLPDEIISFLIEANPDATKMQDRLGRVPLHYAFSNLRSSDILTALIHIFPQCVRAPDKKSGWTPLHIAVTTNVHPDVIRLMINVCPESVLMRMNSGSTVVELAEESEFQNKTEIIDIVSKKVEELQSLPEYKNFVYCFDDTGSTTSGQSSAVSSYASDKQKQKVLPRHCFV